MFCIVYYGYYGKGLCFNDDEGKDSVGYFYLKDSNGYVMVFDSYQKAELQREDLFSKYRDDCFNVGKKRTYIKYIK